MQKIFYNARFITMNDKDRVAEAMLVNDDSIVFVGQKDEVLQMKTDETEVIDLEQKTVIPTFFDVCTNVYDEIENRLKNAEQDEFLEKTAQNDENYEIFDNFDIYKTEFLEIQNELLKLGVTTIQEKISSKEEFVFWKKISEEGSLKIDVIGYVDFVKNKQIMDDNCRSYRKYKNHFRLGGYHITLDGLVLERKACLTKRYPKEKHYSGYLELGLEQLKFIIKTALEEKKQLMVFAEGDKAVKEFLTTYTEQVKETPVEDNFRPIIIGSNFVSKKLLQLVNQQKIKVCFRIDEIMENYDTMNSFFGKRKLKKAIPLMLCKKENMKYLLCSNTWFNSFKVYDFLEKDNKTAKSLFGKHEIVSKNDLLEMLTIEPAYYAFDMEQKGSFESGKKANFLVLNHDLSEGETKVEQIYLEANLIYEVNKK